MLPWKRASVAGSVIRRDWRNKQAGNDLEIVLDPVVDFLEEDFLFLEGRLDLGRPVQDQRFQPFGLPVLGDGQADAEDQSSADEHGRRR